MAVKLYPWKRFWYPREGEVSLADEGFLLNPDSEYAKYYQSDVVPFENIRDTPCLVLLGEPGIGKSVALESEFEGVDRNSAGTSDRAVWLRLGDSASEDHLRQELFESSAFQEWRQGRGTLSLFLDSLDEGLLQIDNISRVLLSGLKRCPTERLRLRVTCRPLDWQTTFEGGLREIWGEDRVGVFQLAPLRKEDVAIAATQSGITEPNEFIRQIIEREVVPFAVVPVTLEFLIGAYRENRALPARRTDLYFQGCKRLCEEQNVDRRDSTKGRGDLLPGQRMAVAVRIAALTELSRRSSIWFGPEDGARPEDLRLESILGGFESEPAYVEIKDAKTVRDTLGTALFTTAGINRHRWQHQSFSEYLAAFHLDAHRVPLERLRWLILHPDGSGKVIPQLRELVVWLSQMNTELFRMVAQTDPEVLLGSDMAVTTNGDKAALTECLLENFESGTVIPDVWLLSRNLSKLTNPSIAGAVRPYLSDRARGLNARVVAVEIARACKATAVLPCLVSVAIDLTEDSRLRACAAAAIGDIGDATSREALRPMALAIEGGDPRDELKGQCLAAVWPAHLSAEELFSALSPPKHHGGSYRNFLEKSVVPNLAPDDLIPAIRWASAQAERHPRLDSLGELASAVLERAVAEIGRPGIVQPFAAAMFKRMEAFAEPEAVINKLRARGDEARRVVAHSMFEISAGKTLAAFFVIDACTLGANDIDWLLSEFSSASSGDPRRTIAEVISRRLDPNDVDTIDKVLCAAETSPDLRQSIGSAAIELGTPEAERLKRDYDEYMANQRPETPPASLPVAVRLSEILAQESPERFFRVFCLLRQEHHAHGEPLPEWSNFDAATKAWIVRAAAEFLSITPPTPEGNWWRTGTLTLGMLAGSSALMLLAATSPASLDLIADSDWAVWARVALAFCHGDPLARSVLLEKAYCRARDTLLSTLGDIIDGENKGHKPVFVLNQIAGLWNDDIASVLRSKLADCEMAPASFGALLAKLLQAGDVVAKATAWRYVDDSEFRQRNRERALVAIPALLSSDPSSWGTVWRQIQQDEAFIVEVLEKVAYEHQYDSFANSIGEASIADICIWVVQRGLEKEKDAQDSGFVTPRVALSNWWNTLVNLLARRATKDACDGLRRLVEAAPQYEGLKRTLSEAEERLRRATWEPLLPRKVLTLDLASAGKLVISVHGIRTSGPWQKRINTELQKAGFRHESFDYGYFGIVRFLLARSREKKIDWFRSKYEDLVSGTDIIPSVIAHSFGTYIVASALEKYEEIRFARVIFCGSIVRRDFAWPALLATGRIGALLNDYGGRDIWVKLAGWFIPDAGPSGAIGFESSDPCLYQRCRPRFRHSDYFYPLNYVQNWVPFLKGSSPSGEATERKPAWNWRFALLVAALLVALGILLWFVAKRL